MAERIDPRHAGDLRQYVVNERRRTSCNDPSVYWTGGYMQCLGCAGFQEWNVSHERSGQLIQSCCR